MIELSADYFKNFHVAQPVVQILQSRSYESDVIRLRLRCSDGLNAYDQIGISKNLEGQIIKDGIYKHEKYPVIMILKYEKIGCAIIIEQYKVLASSYKIIGCPKTFSCACHGHDENEALVGFKPTAPAIQKLTDKAIPIAFLTPWLSSSWIIAVTVEEVGKIFEIQSKNGLCKFFTFVVKDSKGDRIRVKSFGENAVRFGKIVQTDKDYIFECDPSCIKEKYNRFENDLHDYEIVLNDSSVVKMFM